MQPNNTLQMSKLKMIMAALQAQAQPAAKPSKRGVTKKAYNWEKVKRARKIAKKSRSYNRKHGIRS